MNKITEQKKTYWTTRYRLEPTVELQKLIEAECVEVFKGLPLLSLWDIIIKSKEDRTRYLHTCHVAYV